MKKLILLFTCLLIATSTLWADNYDFAAQCSSGQTLYYSYNDGVDGASVTVTYPNYKPYYNYYYNYTSPTGNLVIPSSVTYNGKTYSVTSIERHAFYGCTGLPSVTIPNSVTIIGSEAFYGCSGLTSVTIPNSVTSIGYDAFYNTCWWNNQSNGIIYKNGWCLGYKGNKPTGKLTILEGTKGIADGAFGLNFNSFPPYRERADYSCTGLTSVSIPNSVTVIGYGAFSGCSGLTGTLTIPNSVTSIGSYAFQSCSKLTSVTIPNSVTSIGNGAFNGCTGLTTVNFNATNCTTMGASGYLAFYNCSKLKTLTIGNNVQSIPAYAFKDCSGITSVSIPNTVTSIGNCAFQYCTGITEITCEATNTPEIGDYTFSSYSVPLYVPAQSITAYRNHAIWGEFLNIRAIYTITANTNNASMGGVSGSGTYKEGKTATLTAIPNTGYHFVRWNDGSTTNPRTFTPTSNVTYTATFAIDTYTITANTNNATMGSVSGSNTYNHGTTVTLTATPKTGYHFVQWSDGSTTNPRTFTATGNATYTATFAINTYTITANTNNTTMGSVSGSNTYNHGTTVTLTATPKTGYHFVQWSDGSTTNPRTFTAIGNATYTATFAINTYLVNVNANNAAMGSVSGSNTYNHGATTTLTATPADHHHFVQWSDGNMQNPRQITVTESINLTAIFAIDTYSITATSANNTTGSVAIANEAASYDYGSTVFLTATPAEHYHFVQWNDGNKDNPRQIIVTEDNNFTATFAIDIYTVTTLVNNSNWGSVAGGGSYQFNTTTTLTATPNEHYHFVQWSDGNTQNPREINVTDNITLTANFTPNTYTVTVNANNNMGRVSGGGSYGNGAVVTLTATPNAGYKFVSWSDGSTQNPRQITVSGDVFLSANFETDISAVSYTLTVLASNNAMGSVSGNGTYAEGTIVTLTATPNDGYKFVSWSDGNTNNPRQVTVTENATYIANFAANNASNYTITVLSSNNAMGSVSGNGSYAEGTVITLIATPNNGYKFVSWSDGNTQNPRQITITGNATYIATFIQSNGTDAIAEANSSNAQIFGGEKRIIINNAANATVAIYDVMGRTVVKEQRINTNNAVFAMPQRGMYIVHMSKAAKKVWVR